MREPVLKLEPSEIEHFRDIDIAIRAYETGAVQVEFTQVQAAYRAMLDWWIRIYEQYDLEETEYYEVNPINGLLYIDKE